MKRDVSFFETFVQLIKISFSPINLLSGFPFFYKMTPELRMRVKQQLIQHPLIRKLEFNSRREDQV